jgi:cysteine desulfurase
MTASAVYFDHNATTPLDPRVLVAMRPWLERRFGNPSSIHSFGQAARDAVEQAREQLAALLGARPRELTFVASGSEANNTVVASALEGATQAHCVLSALEHPSVDRAAQSQERKGATLTRIAPSRDGEVDPAHVIAALRPHTALVAVMLASNELGTVQPVAAIAAACRERGVPTLCDAVQAVGKLRVDVNELGIDFLTVGAHKLRGPLGAGALYVRSGTPLAALIHGGGQERARRAGTENVAAIVGLGAAAALAGAELADRTRHLAYLRDQFERGLEAIEGCRVNGRSATRLPNTTSVTIDGVDAHLLAIRLDLAGFAVSPGAACASGTVEASRALLAIGLAEAAALATVRISFGADNSTDEVDAFLGVLAGAIAAQRSSRRTGVAAPLEARA